MDKTLYIKNTDRNLRKFPVNSHIHLPPNFSAFDSIEQAAMRAKNENIKVLGVSNYYDFSVYEKFAAECAKRGIYALFGLETIALLDDLESARIKINDPGNFGKMYLCGKAITQFSPLSGESLSLISVLRKNDGDRLNAVIVRLVALLAEAGAPLRLTADSIKNSIAKRCGVPVGTVYLQERHIAQAFQEALFDSTTLDARTNILTALFGVQPKNTSDPAIVQAEIRAHLMKAGKPAFVPDTFVDFDHAYKLILSLGGIPAYPLLIDGTSPICGFEESIDKLIDELKLRGIHAVEFIPSRNRISILKKYVPALREAGFVATAGTEHNTPDLIPITPSALDGEIPDDIAEIFVEGALVLAGHQEAAKNGKPGFVSSTGAPNSAYSNADERIAAFARDGYESVKKIS